MNSLVIITVSVTRFLLRYYLPLAVLRSLKVYLILHDKRPISRIKICTHIVGFLLTIIAT